MSVFTWLSQCMLSALLRFHARTANSMAHVINVFGTMITPPIFLPFPPCIVLIMAKNFVLLWLWIGNFI